MEPIDSQKTFSYTSVKIVIKFRENLKSILTQWPATVFRLKLSLFDRVSNHSSFDIFSNIKAISGYFNLLTKQRNFSINSGAHNRINALIELQ